MDATVNNFLNEINEIAPENHNSEEAKDWQECFDELTGYSYYWNTKTDKVTWVEPKLFKKENAINKKHEKNLSGRPVTNRKPDMPRSAALFSNAVVNPEAKVKIYSLQETLENKSQNKNVNFCCKKKRDSSDDEKIELITEFSNDNDSESESKSSRNINGDNRELDCSNHSDDDDDEDDDVDLLVKIQQKAQELQHLGGKVPAEVKTIIQANPPLHENKLPTHVPSISLVAGYHSSDSEAEDEQHASSSKFNILSHSAPNVEKSHSTLFPITEPINVNDFISTNIEPEKETDVTGVDTNTFDSKAFQRKRRIGVSLVNNSKKVKTDTEISCIEHDKIEPQGLKSTSCENNLDTVKYPGFQKGGVMFLKGDTVNPIEEKVNTDNQLKEDDNNLDRDKTMSNYNILKEKLKFLCEGRSPILPVQAMLIQAETLFMAMEEKCLKMSYLYNWLEQNCSELTNLEKDAAPDGWLLQWDRSNKRYFYLNQTTGESQWEYPQPDITRCDDAMDISTTPPPPQLEESPSLCAYELQANFGPQLPVEPPLPPPPPKISSPTPPPAPMISKELKKDHLSDVSLPSEQALPSIPMPLENYEPLPPGVDSSDVAASYKNSSETKTVRKESLNSVLDSFYSEIAEVSERDKSELISVNQQSAPDKDVMKSQDLDMQLIGEQMRKKKKKVKLAQGLTMKKKGVSELVEKWKSVQKSYGN